MEKNKLAQKNQEDIKKIRFKIEIAVLIILILIGGYLIYKKVTEKPEQPIVEEPKCEVLYENCRNANCEYYYLCNIIEDFESCKIYDCTFDIKAEITNKQGDIIENRREKINKEKVYNNIRNCKGTTEIINNQCIVGKKELKVQVKTQGECLINAFVVNQGQKDYAPQFEKRDNYFHLTLRSCDTITKLVAVSEKGIPVE